MELHRVGFLQSRVLPLPDLTPCRSSALVEDTFAVNFADYSLTSVL